MLTYSLTTIFVFVFVNWKNTGHRPTVSTSVYHGYNGRCKRIKLILGLQPWYRLHY